MNKYKGNFRHMAKSPWNYEKTPGSDFIDFVGGWLLMVGIGTFVIIFILGAIGH